MYVCMLVCMYGCMYVWLYVVSPSFLTCIGERNKAARVSQVCHESAACTPHSPKRDDGAQRGSERQGLFSAVLAFVFPSFPLICSLSFSISLTHTHTHSFYDDCHALLSFLPSPFQFYINSDTPHKTQLSYQGLYWAKGTGYGSGQEDSSRQSWASALRMRDDHVSVCVCE